MTVTRDSTQHGPYSVEAVRFAGKLTAVVIRGGNGYWSAGLYPSLESLRALRHAADLIDQSLAFDGCERPVDPERKETP